MHDINIGIFANEKSRLDLPQSEDLIFFPAAHLFARSLARMPGHPSACRNLALLYSLAEDRPDWERAFHYFLKAARLGNVKAMESVAQCYRLGQGCTQVRKIK